MKVAAIQMVSSTVFDENLSSALSLIARACTQGAELVVLPEMFLTFGRRQTLDNSYRQRFMSTMADQSARHGVWIVAGTYPLSYPLTESSGKLSSDEINLGRQNSGGDERCHEQSHEQCDERNRKPHAVTLVFDPNGNVAGAYAKIHLFDVDVNDSNRRYRESDDFAHGEEVVAVDSPWGPLGLAVCYDLRFPELFTTLASKGCRLLCLPSAFTHATGKAHWEILIRARAIETQCFVVAASQGGVHSEKRKTWGHSMIASPWGDVIGELGQGEGVLVADLDIPGDTEALRKAMPIGQHRRLVPKY